MNLSIGFSTGSSFWISVPGIGSSSMLTFGRQIMILFTLPSISWLRASCTATASCLRQ